MATLKLFGNKISPACRYCDEAMQQVGDNILCMKRGIVPPDHACRKFVYDPTKRVPSKPMPLEAYSEEDFSISTSDEEAGTIEPDAPESTNPEPGSSDPTITLELEPESPEPKDPEPESDSEPESEPDAPESEDPERDED